MPKSMPRARATAAQWQGVAFDSHGNFFVANSNASVFKIPAPSYSFAITIAIGQSGIDHPFGIAFDSHDNLFVADQLSGSGQILELTAASGYATVNTITSGNLQQPVGVAVDSRGNLYVTDSAPNTLTEFAAPDYTTAQVIVSTGLSGPMGVALDADDNIFVVDTGHNALKEILAQPAVTGLAPAAGPAARRQHGDDHRRASDRRHRGILRRQRRHQLYCRQRHPGDGDCASRQRHGRCPRDDAQRHQRRRAGGQIHLHVGGDGQRAQSQFRPDGWRQYRDDHRDEPEQCQRGFLRRNAG